MIPEVHGYIIIRQLLFGVAVAVLVGPLDFGDGYGHTAGILIVSLATIPTSKYLFHAFGAKLLGFIAMILFGGVIVMVNLWIVDPIYELDLSFWRRLAAFIGILLGAKLLDLLVAWRTFAPVKSEPDSA